MKSIVRRIKTYWYSFPSLIPLIFLMIYPAIYVIYMCFHEWERTSGTTKFVGLNNFRALLTGEEYRVIFGNTIIFAGLTLILEFLLGFGIALYFSQEMKGKSILRTFMIMPMATAPLIVALMWRLILNPDFGILGQFLKIFGIGPINWIGSPNLALYTCILVDVWQYTPFIFLIIYAGLQSIPIAPYEAAMIDGASKFQIFKNITLPMLRSAITVAVLFKAVDGFKVFDLIFGLTYGGPGIRTNTLPFRAYQIGWSYLRIGEASVLSVVIMIIAIIICLLFLKLQPEE